MKDIEPRLDLDTLDPGQGDSAYWDRFHARVMAAAGSELARRRALPLSVSGILLSWSRLLVPGAVAAAVAAGILLVPSGPTVEPSGLLGLGVEDILREEASRSELAPIFLGSEDLYEDHFLGAVERFAARGDR